MDSATQTIDPDNLSLIISEKNLLGLLFRDGAKSQALIADSTGLTQQSASRLVTRLSAAGLLQAGEKSPLESAVIPAPRLN